MDYRKGHGIRHFPFAPRAVDVDVVNGDVILMRSSLELDGVRRNIVDYLREWAQRTPDQVFLAEPNARGGWDRLTYGEVWWRVRAIGTWLVENVADADRPIAILSPPSINHALLMFGAMAVGRAVAPISPSYSSVPAAFARLEGIAALLNPAVVFADDPEAYVRARTVPELAAALWIGAEDGANVMSLRWLETSPIDEAFDRAYAAVDHDVVGKILFTSGSTGAPKGVINTHGTMCSSIAAVGQFFPTDQPTVMVDWLPWHHTMGGNVNLHGTMRDGGSFYIDKGKPTAADFSRTIKALREISPSWTQAVPIAVQMLVDAMDEDPILRDTYFAKMRYMVYAGSGLKPELWARVQDHCVAATGQNIAFFGGYGATETGPTVSSVHWFTEGVGHIGLPVPGVELKLLPLDGERYELRVRGPNVTPGYYGRADLTAGAFDADGYYQIGDTVRFVDQADPSQGLLFAGRLAETFKLSNGAWVSPSELRASILDEASPWLDDLVVAGHERDDIRLLVWPSAAARKLDDAELEGHVRAAVARHNRVNSAATQKIAAFAILDEPPSVGAGELTDKGSINQRAALEYRAEAVRSLYDA